MGNFMIGDFYPPFLGNISKIMCGSEQCWPNTTSQTPGFYLQYVDSDDKILIEPYWWQEGSHYPGPEVGDTVIINCVNKSGVYFDLWYTRLADEEIFPGHFVEQGEFYFPNSSYFYQYSDEQPLANRGTFTSSGTRYKLNCIWTSMPPTVFYEEKTTKRLYRIHVINPEGKEIIYSKKVSDGEHEVVVPNVIVNNQSINVTLKIYNSYESYSASVQDTEGWSYSRSGTWEYYWGYETDTPVDLYVTIKNFGKGAAIKYSIICYENEDAALIRNPEKIVWRETETIYTTVPYDRDAVYSADKCYMMSYAGSSEGATTIYWSEIGSRLIKARGCLTLSSIKTNKTSYGSYWRKSMNALECSNIAANHVLDMSADEYDCEYIIPCYPDPNPQTVLPYIYISLQRENVNYAVEHDVTDPKYWSAYVDMDIPNDYDKTTEYTYLEVDGTIGADGKLIVKQFIPFDIRIRRVNSAITVSIVAPNGHTLIPAFTSQTFYVNSAHPDPIALFFRVSEEAELDVKSSVTVNVVGCDAADNPSATLASVPLNFVNGIPVTTRGEDWTSEVIMEGNHLRITVKHNELLPIYSSVKTDAPSGFTKDSSSVLIPIPYFEDMPVKPVSLTFYVKERL